MTRIGAAPDEDARPEPGPGVAPHPRQAARPAGRKLAEWLTLALSLVLIAAVAGFLAFEATKPSGPFVGVDVRTKLEALRQEAGRYILPVEVENLGRQTLQGLELRVTHTPSGAAEPVERAVKLDYLGERSTQTVYLYFDHDPRETGVEITPLHYRVD